MSSGCLESRVRARALSVSRSHCSILPRAVGQGLSGVAKNHAALACKGSRRERKVRKFHQNHVDIDLFEQSVENTA